MIQNLSRWLLKILGWKSVGELPALKKYVVVAAPHTSNWDFIIGKLFYLSVGIKSYVMIKRELFFFPLGNILKSLGGIPVDRKNKTDIVDQMVHRFKSEESFILTLTPEGTRKRVTEWKTGFHRIALGAGVPVVPGFFDYKSKTVGTGDLIWLTDNLQEDMQVLKGFYSDKHALYPEKFTVDDQ